MKTKVFTGKIQINATLLLLPGGRVQYTSHGAQHDDQLGQGWRISCRQVGPPAGAEMGNQLPSGRLICWVRNGGSAVICIKGLILFNR